ncbi:1,4-alpha-glucan branching protein [Streptomyces sp. NPDC046727]|uniref:maltokinase N-terminal cap-like domain-containing protein n=1 Tax=Streptomyces sp. NPDC046727 TaxID=3155373 RepID=UPI0033C7946E
MAIVHQTTLKPTKLELVTGWLPGRPWYRAGTGAPALEKSGGFRLDDPAGEVGMEIIVITDTATPEPTVYLVPLTYRGAPLPDAEHALVGTMEHGVLGTRWAYDGCHDPVLVAELLALIEGRAEAQDQNASEAPDPEVTRSYTGAPFTGEPSAPDPVDDENGTRLPAPHGTTLRVHRVLTPRPENPPVRPDGAIGHVASGWQAPDGSRARGVFAVLEPH